jgi:predicted PurR-regulated permease PerM
MAISSPPSGPGEATGLLAFAGKATDPRRDLVATIRATIILAATVFVIWVLSDVILLIFLAVLLGAMLRGLADWLAGLTGLPTWATLTLVSVTLVLLVGGIFWWIGPQFVSQGRQLWAQVADQLKTVRHEYGNILGANALPTKNGEIGLTHSAATVATSTLGFLGDLLVVIATALYLAIAPQFYRDGVVRLFPLSYRARAREVLNEIGCTLQWWLLGQAIDMAVVGVLTGIGLFLLGVPLALALAVLAGLFTFVPYFGPIVSAIPAIIVAATISWSKVLWVIVIYLICHGIEGYVVAPFVQRRTVELPPAVTILSMAVMAALFGALGLMVATPMVAAILVIVREVYVRDILGDPGADLAPVVQRTPISR